MLILGFVVIQSVIFLIVFLVLRRMMIHSTTSAVNRLKLTDEENTKRLEEIKKKIEESETEHQRRGAELTQELERQREEAKKQSGEEKNKLLEKAREEGGRILEAAKTRAEKVNQEIEKEVQDRSVDLALKIVVKALSKTMKGALHEGLVEELLHEVEGMEMGHVPDETREVEIIQSHSLSPDRKKKIKEILEKKLGREVELKETFKQDMVGGLSLNLGSLVLDGSLENVLKDVARELKKQQ